MQQQPPLLFNAAATRELGMINTLDISGIEKVKKLINIFNADPNARSAESEESLVHRFISNNSAFGNSQDIIRYYYLYRKPILVECPNVLFFTTPNYYFYHYYHHHHYYYYHPKTEQGTAYCVPKVSLL